METVSKLSYLRVIESGICDFFSGWLAGVGGLLVGHPLETLKVRRQTENSKVFHIIKSIIRDEGIKGYYKGFIVPFLTTGITNAVFFGVFSNILTGISGQKEKICCEPGEIPQWHLKLATASFSGAFVYLLVSCPLEVVKTRLQVDKKLYPLSMRKTVKMIFKESGTKGFYKGWTALCIRDLPYLTLYPLVYDRITCRLRKLTNQTDLDIRFQLLAGGSTGILTWLPLIPADVIKARIQADNILNPKYHGFIDCFRKSLRNGGIAEFYHGFTVSFIRVFIVNAIILPVFNNSVKICNEISKPKTEEKITNVRF